MARLDPAAGGSVNLAWYVARSGGMVAFGLLTASVLLGILLAGRKTLPRWPRFAVEDVHRFAGTLTWTFIGDARRRAAPRHLHRLLAPGC